MPTLADAARIVGNPRPAPARRTHRRTVMRLAGPGIRAAREVYTTVPADAVRVAALVKKYGPSSSSSLLRADIYEAAGRHAEAAAACDSAIAMLDASVAKGDDPLTAIREQILARKEENLAKTR